MKLHLPKGLFIAVLAACVATQEAYATGNIGWSTGCPGTDVADTHVLYIGDTVENENPDATNRAGIGTISLKEGTTNHIVISSVTVPNDYDQNLEDFRISSDGVSNQVATITALNVKNGSDITVGVNGWNSNSFKNLIIENLTVADAGTATVDVHANQTVTLGNITGVCTAAVADNATLYISGTNDVTNGDLIVSTTGAGDIVLTQNATLNANDTSKATGNLKIQGATLNVKIGRDSGISLASFTSWTLDDAIVQYHGAAVQLNDITVASTGAEIQIEDMANNAFITLKGTTTLEGNLSVKLKDLSGDGKAWKGGMTFESLTGDGNLDVTSGNQGDKTIINIQSLSNYGGDITITKATGPAILNLSGTLDAGTAENATTIKAVNGATVNVGAAGVETTLSGNIEFANGTGINLQDSFKVAENSLVTFNGNKLSFNGNAGELHEHSITTNGLQQMASTYTIATGNLSGIQGTVTTDGYTEAQQITNGTVSAKELYYVIAESGTEYDKTISISEAKGYLVTNGATFDVNLQDDGSGFQPHLYLDAGTTIRNGGGNLGTSKVAILNMTLLGDATVNATEGHQYGMLRNTWHESTLSLRGNTLTKTGDGIFHLVNTTVSNGTIDVQEGQLWIESKTGYHAPGTVFNNAAVNVGSEGTLHINSMKNAATVGELLAATSGTGTIELAAGAHLKDGDEMTFEGKLVIKAGADLRIGIEGTAGWGYSAQSILLTKLDSIELAGGTLSTRFYSGDLGDIQVTSNSTLHAVDISAANGVKEQMNIGTLSIDEGRTLTLKAGWKANIAVSQLTGKGSVSFTAVSEDSGNRDLVVNSIDAFTGNFSIENHSGNKAFVRFNVQEGETLNASQITASNHSSVSIGGAGIYNMGNQTYIAKATVSDQAVERGNFAEDWTGKVTFSGASFSNTDLNNYGNTNSTISIHQSSGSLTDGTIVSDIEFVETSGASALDLQATNAANLVFAGDISGKGNFGYAESSGHQVSFTGDVAEWTGILWASAASEVTYSDNAKVISNAISAGGGATSTVNFVNTDGMQVASDINTQEWSNGTLNLKVLNDEKATGTVEFSGAIFNGTTEKGRVATTNLTVETGAAAKFTNASVQLNDILVQAQAQLAFTGAEALSVSKLELQQGAAVSVGTVENPQGTLTVTKEATFNGGQVNANLTLKADAKVTMGSALTMGSAAAPASETGTTSTGYTLSLEKGITLKLQDDLLNQLNNLTASSEPLVLITGVNTLQLGEQTYTVGSQVLTDAKSVSLTDYITIEGFEQYYVGFDTMTGSVIAGLNVPEPTTATLGLLALAGLCARRRRK